MKLEFNSLTKRYKAKTALDDFNYTLSEGIHALLGPNGSGKSTLMNILAGILKPTDGNITLDNKDTIKLGDSFRDILGYLPQYPGFYPSFTGYNLMKYFATLKGVDNPKSRIDELLEFVNLSSDSHRKYGEYSGGMKRRLGIAISLLNDPKILILDEPTAGLDPKERMRFRNILSQISRNKIIIVATHIVSDVETIADNIILLKSGRIVLSGSVTDVEKHISEKVWNVETNANEAEQYVLSNSNANIIKQGDSVFLRIVSDEPPFEDAVLAEPTLEDVYMYCFDESGSAGDEDEDISL